MTDLPAIPNITKDNLVKVCQVLKTRAEIRDGDFDDNDQFVTLEFLLDLLGNYGFPKEYTAKQLYKTGATQAAAGAVEGEIWIDTSAGNTFKLGV